VKDIVNAKGRGKLQTYFVEPAGCRGYVLSATTSMGADSDADNNLILAL
jgi:hypothetical protein